MQIPKPSSRIQAAGLIVFSVVLANILATWVLGANLRAMLYPSDADTIMIPIASNFLNSINLLILATTGALLPRHHIVWRVISRLLLLLAGLYALALTMYWWYPHHYWAGVAFLPPAVACAWALYLPATTREKIESHSMPS